MSILHWYDNLFSKKQSNFLVYFVMIFLGSAALLAAIGFLPSELKENSNSNNFVEEIFNFNSGGSGSNDTSSSGSSGASIVSGNSSTKYASTTTSTTQQPVKLIAADRLQIPALGIDTVVRNPTSTSVSVLDNELTKGVVRYPGSGTIGNGNMFIFGHSTGWSVVQNKAYKVFNELKNAQKGDEILLKSGSVTFVYKVRTVTKVDKNDTMIKFDTTANMLTLSTCDSFGKKADRYVVEADYIGVKGA